MGLIIMSHVPFAAEADGVAAGRKRFGKSRLSLQEIMRGSSDAIVHLEKILHAMMRGQAAGEIGHAAGGTDRCARERAREPRPFGGQAVQMGRVKILAAVRMERPRAMIVGEN